MACSCTVHELCKECIRAQKWTKELGDDPPLEDFPGNPFCSFCRSNEIPMRGNNGYYGLIMCFWMQIFGLRTG